MPAPLVLIPGLSCDEAAWRPVAARMPDVECVIPAVPARDDLGRMAEDLLAILPRTFALAGHSMGGRIALEMVRREPTRITHLALLDTGFRPRMEGDAGDAELAQRKSLLDLASVQGMRAMARAWAEPMVHPMRLADPTLMSLIVEMIARSNVARFAREVHALLMRPDASDVLPAIACPTLVACGREDAWATLHQHDELASRIPGSRIVAFGACGHMAPMERPGAVARALLDLLSEPARKAPTATFPRTGT